MQFFAVSLSSNNISLLENHFFSYFCALKQLCANDLKNKQISDRKSEENPNKIWRFRKFV